MSDYPPQLFGDDIVELRVHGVGGTPPADLLSFPDDAGFPEPHRIAGDHIAGFYRRPWPVGRHRLLEGYSWGGLTSRKGSRALWLLLLPFSIINAAGWLVEPRRESAPHPTTAPQRPDTSKVARGARLQWALIRIVAAGITLLFVAWVSALTVDLVAYQCGGQTSCSDGRWWMTPFTMDWIQEYPARRMMLGTLAPLTLIGLVVFLAFRSRNRYEAYTPEGTDGDQPNEFGADGAGLADKPFWRSGDLVRRATYSHVGAAISTVGGLYALAVFDMTGGASNESRPFAVVFALFVVAIVAGLALSGRPIAAGTDDPHPEWHLRWAAPAGLTVAAFVAGWTDGMRVPVTATSSTGFQPVFARAPLYIALGVVAVIGAMLLVRCVQWWRDPAKDRFLRFGITLPWVVLVAAAVWWHRIPWLSRLPTFVAAGIAAAGVASVTWLTARHRPWRMVVLVVAAASVAIVVAGIRSDHRALQWVGLAVIGAALLPTVSAQLGRQDRWRWAAPVAGAALALATLMVALAGSISRAADFLDRGDDPGAPVIATLGSYGLIALLLVAGLSVTLVAGLFHFLRVRLDLWGPLAGDVAAEYVDDNRPAPGDEYEDCVGDGDRPGPVVRRAVMWRSLATASRDVDVLLTSFSMIPLLATLFALARVALNAGTNGSEIVSVLENPPISDEWSLLVTGATWIASLAPLVGVLAIRASLSNESIRRGVGIAWDVLTFWPRRFHPLGPPAYSERAVPELARRIRQLTRHDDARVILSAHSQGGVVAAATLASLLGEGHRPSRVAVVTHGNPSGRLYRRFFPGYFGGGILRWLRANVAAGDAWLNLYRLTDPIGDAIFTGADEDMSAPVGGRTSGDVMLRDPAMRWRFSLDPCPPIAAHSPYLDDPEAALLVDAIAGSLTEPASRRGSEGEGPPVR